MAGYPPDSQYGQSVVQLIWGDLRSTIWQEIAPSRRGVPSGCPGLHLTFANRIQVSCREGFFPQETGQAGVGFRTNCETTIPRVKSDIKETIPNEMTQ